MNYSLNDLNQHAIGLIFAGLGKLPYEDSYQLIAHLNGQLQQQAKAAAKTPAPELHDVAGDADDLIKE